MKPERKLAGRSRRFSRPLSRPASPLAAAGCCCFARGLWEVLLLRGQAGAPPSSCFDRHRVLAHLHRRFPCSSRCCGFSRKRKNKTGPLLRRYNTGAAVCSGRCFGSVKLGIDPKESLHDHLEATLFFFLIAYYSYPNQNVCELSSRR